MNIVIVTPSYFPSRGGTEQAIFEWAKRFTIEHGVRIVALNHTNAPGREVSPEGIEIHRLPKASIRIIGHAVRAILIFARLSRLDKESRIDLIHLGHVFQMGLGVMLFAKLRKRPVVTTLLGWDTYDPIKPVPAMYAPYLRFVMNASDRIVAMSSHIAESAGAQGCRRHIELIPHGSTMRGRRATIDVRRAHGIPGPARICFSLQRLHPRKGLQYLLEAVPRVAREMGNVAFIIGGTGAEERSLKEVCETLGIRERVLFAGFIPDTDLVSYYDQADLFVLPTLYEAFGLVYADAVVRGLPIVTTRTGGALDIVGSDVGILVPPRNAAALADAIVAALNRSWDRRAIAARGSRYDWDRIAADYLAIYKALVNG
ncbi:MAG: glycosyltransferase [Chitinivibrionales bacterium]|nr:glycosyltransferase [Chitinivibrionales bacterium]MBD3395940.1 glycosyltransferase [Chitinivibrionales bacterium]